MSSRKILLALLFIFGISVSVLPQDKKPTKTEEEDEVIRVDTELVEVPMVVTDRTGKPLLSLKQNNFTVLEDGKPQEIAEFSATSAPFEVVLLARHIGFRPR